MFSKSIQTLSDNLSSLREFVDLLDAYLTQQGKRGIKENLFGAPILVYAMQKFESSTPSDGNVSDTIYQKYPWLEKIEFKLEDDGKKGKHVSISIKDKDVYEKFVAGPQGFHKLTEELQKSHRRKELLYYSSLMNLISSVEWFFSQILHIYFEKYPAAINNKDKTFSFDDLKKFGSLDDAKQYYIDSKVGDILYGSFSDWVEFLREKVKLKAGYLEDQMSLLVETFQRRNLVVHNGGIVNSRYLASVSKELTKNLKIGDRIIVARDYLDNRIDLFEQNCILIAAELWKKINNDDNERSQILLDMNYTHLCAKRWSISEAMSQFIVNDKKAPETCQLIGKINYWLCLKRLGRWNEIKNEIESADFSAKEKIFQLALASLKEEKDLFFKMLPSVVKSGDLSKEHLIEFPVFEEIRSDKRYVDFLAKLQSPKNKKVKTKKRVIKKINLKLKK